MLCSVCHGEIGGTMEKNLAQLTGKRMEKYAQDKDFMVLLMEHWVSKLNRKARHLLTKAVACVDCHEVDPRR
jgi:cytochrome c553